MARWRLTQPHYLNVPGTEWERVETNRASGQQGRQRFSVPRLLSPDDPTCHNYPDECIVWQIGSKTKPGSRDFHFEGEPTPDMEPMDEEAEQITESLKHKWIHPIDSLQDGGYTQAMFADLTAQLTAAIANAGGIPKGPVAVPAEPDVMAAIKTQIAELSAKVEALSIENAELKAGRRSVA